MTDKKAILTGDTVYVTLPAVSGHSRKVIKATVVQGDSTAEACRLPASTFVVTAEESVVERGITKGQRLEKVTRDQITPVEVEPA